MPRFADIDRVIARHRRVVACAGVLVVLGVVALNAHEALPEHHHVAGNATMCIAALAIATLTAIGWCKQLTPSPKTTRIGLVLPLKPAASSSPDSSRASARAGPTESAVLRR